jgi:hypothetical protein
VRLLPEYKTQDTPVYALYPHSHCLSAKTRTFVDFLAARFGHLPRIKQNGGDSAIDLPPDLRATRDHRRDATFVCSGQLNKKRANNRSGKGPGLRPVRGRLDF